MEQFDTYRFPPPRKQSHAFALVVEKKGDDSRTSMKQNEIYCYSPDIKMDSGVMLMPKDTWKHYEIGDWIYCEKLYADRQDQKQYQERELIKIKYVEKKYYKSLNLPVVSVFATHAYIMREFVVCPNFFKNRAKEHGGSFRKLIILDIGLGFVNLKRNQMYHKLKQDITYRGLFQFKSKNNGGVNFQINELDVNGHPLEMHSLWELEEIVPLKHAAQTDNDEEVDSQRTQEIKPMEAYLEEVKKWAVEYANEFEPPLRKKELKNNNSMAPLYQNLKGFGNPNRADRYAGSGPSDKFQRPFSEYELKPAKPSGEKKEINQSHPLNNNRRVDVAFIEEQNERNAESTRESSDFAIFDRLRIGSTNEQHTPRENALRRRDTMIEQSTFIRRDGTRAQCYIDRETNRKSTDKEELINLYNIRHSISATNMGQQQVQNGVYDTIDERSYFPPDHVCDATLNLTSDLAALMSSTPMTRSPERNQYSRSHVRVIKKRDGNYYSIIERRS